MYTSRALALKTVYSALASSPNSPSDVSAQPTSELGEEMTEDMNQL